MSHSRDRSIDPSGDTVAVVGRVTVVEPASRGLCPQLPWPFRPWYPPRPASRSHETSSVAALCRARSPRRAGAPNARLPVVKIPPDLRDLRHLIATDRYQHHTHTAFDDLPESLGAKPSTLRSLRSLRLCVLPLPGNLNNPVRVSSNKAGTCARAAEQAAIRDVKKSGIIILSRILRRSVTMDRGLLIRRGGCLWPQLNK